jgi:hypothetical protein
MVSYSDPSERRTWDGSAEVRNIGAVALIVRDDTVVTVYSPEV